MPDEPQHTDPGEEPTNPPFEREGDIDEDRQDPPTPKKTDDESPELDGMRATPGDDPTDD